MSQENNLLSIINGCCFGGCYSFKTLSAYDLFIFTLGSIVIISILNFYYQRIPKSNNSINDSQNPIYQTKDILLQSNSAEASFVIAKRSTSILVKVLVFVLIFSFVFTPFQEFLGL